MEMSTAVLMKGEMVFVWTLPSSAAKALQNQLCLTHVMSPNHAVMIKKDILVVMPILCVARL